MSRQIINNLQNLRLIKIVYFSGTGSTAMAAECFEQALKVRNLKVIKSELNVRKRSSDEKEDMLIVLYPVHACNAPEPIYEWIRDISNVNGIPAVVVSVSGGGEITPNTACRVGCINRLKKKGYNVIYEKMLIMPSNWVVATKAGLAARLLEILPSKVENIICDILSGIENRTKPKLLDRFISSIGELEKLGAKSFGKKIKASEDCSGCGWCEQNCLRGNIVLKDSRPVFGDKCILCLKCIYGCPSKALKPGTFKFFVIKEGYNVTEIEKSSTGTELDPVEDLAKGYLWKGVKEYLLEAGHKL